MQEIQTKGLNSYCRLLYFLHSQGPKGHFRVNLGLAFLQWFIIISTAPKSPDSKSARYHAVTFGEIGLFMF